MQFQTLIDHDGQAFYCPEYDTQHSIDELIKDISWRDDKITMFGKTHPQPRMTAWHGDIGVRYTYSRITMDSVLWTPPLLELKKTLEKDLQCHFNSVLVNYYRHGEDHMSWHSDNEKSLGKEPLIASLSYGAERLFQFRHKKNLEQPLVEMKLASGSLLVMKGKLQEFWNHRLVKSKKIQSPRLNLTFRLV